MTFLWRRRRRGTRREALKRIITDNSSFELTIPTHFLCPISLDLMRDPVSLTTGITYDRDNIEKWLEACKKATCPVTNQVLRSLDLVPNHSLRKMIQEWCVENESYGIERIPTPKIPITPLEVSDICEQIESSTRSMDERTCLDLLGKIENLAKESERNKRCLAENGIGSKLAEMFETFSKDCNNNKHVALFEEIVHVLTWCFPLGEKGVSKLKSSVSLLGILGCLMSEESLSLRQDTVFMLKELVFEDRESIDGLIEIEGFQETLVKNVKEPVCNKTTQACLMIIQHLTSRSPISTSRFIELGLMQILLEMLINGNNKSICEKALGVLDNICSSEQGREIMSENDLTVPLLVKKMLRISNGATEFTVSILWKLIRLGDRSEESIVEAVQIGAFQKLLVVLQVGCGEKTKEKVTELLKRMSLHGDKINDCFDSFKYVKRSI